MGRKEFSGGGWVPASLKSMKLLAWNCRGLRNRHAVDELRDIIQAQDPKIVFLSETWSTKDQMEHIGDSLDFEAKEAKEFYQGIER